MASIRSPSVLKRNNSAHSTMSSDTTEKTAGHNTANNLAEAKAVITGLKNMTTTSKKRAAPHPKNGRSESHVYALFVGQGGCGKSTTLNFMFENIEISPVERETGTDKIYEFTASLPGEDKKLSLIDVPGLGDMNSIDWDGRIIKSLDNYFRGHKELSQKYPNVVVIVGRFDDNRIDGDKSSFVKMLKALDTIGFQLFDKKRSNLMVVLTHYMNGKKALRADPTPRIQLIQNLVKSHLNHIGEVGVVLAENEPEDWELEGVAGSFQLKKGVLYPKNVYEHMINLCDSGEDKLGSSVLTTAQNNKKELADSFKKNPIITNLIDELEGERMTATLAGIYNRSQSNLMGTLHHRWNSYGKVIDDNNFQQLIAVLSKNNITDAKHIPKNIEESMKIFTSIKKDLYLFQLLEFVKFPIPDYDLIKSVGSGYNIGHDSVTDNNPINFDPSVTKYAVSLLPHRLPKHIDCTTVESEEIIFESLKNKDEYTEARLKNITLDQFDSKSFHFESKPKEGYNFKIESKSKKQAGSSDGPQQSQKQSIVKLKKEFRVAKLEINCPPFSLPINDRFASATRKLKHYKESDRSIRTEWREFFTKWGTHIVKSVYVGGACTVEISEAELFRLEGNFNSLTSEQQKDIMKWLVFDGKGTSVQCNPPIRYKIKFVGGKAPEPREDVKEFEFPPSENQITMFKDWQRDLSRHPVSLETGVELMPLKSLYRDLGPFTQSYDDAFKDLFLTMPTKTSLFEKILKFFRKLKLKKQSSNTKL